MRVDYVETQEGMQPIYSESWSVFKDDQGELWRVKPGDPRTSYQLCVAGTGIDKIWSAARVDAIPIAPKLSAAELEEITQYNQTHMLGWGQKHLVRREVS